MESIQVNLIHTYTLLENIELKAELKPAKHPSHQPTLIYIHGGGFILGERSDLPETYIDMLNDAGYNLLLLDYPLAPEVDLTTIHHCLAQALEWFHLNHQSILGLDSADYYLFGRSAGAYLALLLSAKNPSQYQKGIIAFYGYSSMLSDAFITPNDYYLQFPKHSYMDLYDLTDQGILTEASVKSRYVLYINYRQTGEWLSKVLPDRSQWEYYSLTDQELSKLPQTFLTASNTDKDVPYEASVHLSNIIPNNVFYPVENQYHDFDRDFNNPIAISIYQSLLEWLKKHHHEEYPLPMQSQD
ncbi:alpha/beta hydrolase [Wohlfahrtiimonas larvae]|uniref:Alpha/beta hydrolase n=1 Tax=Wohlfahrtiimonas larvae TaxID=1157986 RepID=A0ABP9N1J2_9GAMM|nr:alpha/beta hydrolase [Wohlfahrtiimonas larvae]